MAEADLFAMMGISGFGKSTKKKSQNVDASKFDKNKRVEVSLLF